MNEPTVIVWTIWENESIINISIFYMENYN